MKNNDCKPMSHLIVNTYLAWAVLILFFYSIALFNIILFTEDKNSERRLATIAPHHFSVFNNGASGEVKVDPLLTIYDRFSALPLSLQRRLSPDWEGSTRYHISDDVELSVFAMRVDTSSGRSIAYAVENIEVIEWDDIDLFLMESAVFIVGLFFLAISAVFIINSAKKISAPFSRLSARLGENKDGEYVPISVPGKLTKELDSMLTSLNSYRQRIEKTMNREQAFTRYVSHELRTPMMVVRGGLSVLRKSADEKSTKQISRIDKAISEMESLMQTFLLLARNEEKDGEQLEISQTLISEIVTNQQELAIANSVTLAHSISETFMLSVHRQLFNVLANNLLKNAINCSLGGEVNLNITSTKMEVIDNGIGLEQKPRGYEGFGIGLNIVRDICEKYGWTFELTSNETKGCTAIVLFNSPSTQ